MTNDVPLVMSYRKLLFSISVLGSDQEERGAFKIIYRKLLSSDSAGAMVCHCSSGASQPCTNMWRLIYEDCELIRDQLGLVYHPESIARRAEILLKDFHRQGIPVQPLDGLLRFLTFETLDLTHTCIRPSYPRSDHYSTSSSDDCSTSSSDANEAEESECIWMKESSVLKRLEDILALLHEESSELVGNDPMVHSQTIRDFLKNKWAPIVSEDIEKHRKKEEEEREDHLRAGAELGVEWVSPGDGSSDMEFAWTLDEWFKKLEEI
jgi:hypothetical protein